MLFSIRKFLSHARLNKRHRHERHVPFWIRLFKHSIPRMFIRLKKQGDRVALQMRGFTLIELLVAMLVATIIISTLLTFTISVMETDRREQAKVESQGEVQAALNYISDDLQEAVYIYNSDGITQLTTATAADPVAVPPVVAAPAQLPVFTDSTPVLVFWKRIYYAPKDDANTSPTKKVGCLEYGTSTTNGTTCSATNPQGSGSYVYSLVAYYLIYDSNSTWSNAARIGRWEIKDGIQASCQSDPITSCPEPKPIVRYDITASPSTGTSFINYWTPPDSGFAPFKAQGDIDNAMKTWKKSGANAYTNSPVVLVDFIDDTPYTALQDNGTPGDSAVDIAIAPNGLDALNRTANTDCLDAGRGVGGTSSAATQRIPSAFQTVSANKAENLSSFYVCVNSSQTVARIYLRGNAMARLKPNQVQSQRSISTQTDTFLSTGNVRAFGRGKLFFK